LYAAIAAGVGLFIALIGFRNAGIVVPDPATTVAMGDLSEPDTALALFGLVVVAGLLAGHVRAAMVIGILATTAAGVLLGIVTWQPQSYSMAELAATAGALDVPGALGFGLLEIVLVFLFIDMFDNIGTLVAVGKKAELFDHANRIPRVNRILISDSLATIGGALTGTSTVVSYIESAAGVAAGGRSGVTAITTGLLFVLALFIAPWAGAIPSAAMAPALIIVGSLMASSMAEIEWRDPETGIPAFLTMLTIPLTFSIANGLAFGFTAYTALQVVRGNFRQVSWFVYILTLLFSARFLYMGKGA
jgi:AGZA family xanthine/uracil permease-like MFS transporter